MSYYFTRRTPSTIMVHEDVVSYPLTEKEIRSNLRYVQQHEAYFEPEYFSIRVKFYQDALEALSKGDTDQ
jgi:hypothetical protein